MNNCFCTPYQALHNPNKGFFSRLCRSSSWSGNLPPCRPSEHLPWQKDSWLSEDAWKWRERFRGRGIRTLSGHQEWRLYQLLIDFYSLWNTDFHYWINHELEILLCFVELNVGLIKCWKSEQEMILTLAINVFGVKI